MSGSLGMGRSKSSNSSEADSNSYGFTSGISGDKSQSESLGISGGQSQSQSNQDIAFRDLYAQLYGNASGAASNVALQAPQLQDAAKQLFTGGSQFLQSLGGNAGTDYQENRLNSNAPVDNIIASMQTDAANLFNNELNPAITARNVAGGTLGGGRQGIAQGVAQAQVSNDFTRNAAALRYQDVQSKDAIAANISGNSIAAANTGLGALPGMLDIMERGQNAELAPYSSLAGILGGPTALTSASSDATDFAHNTAQSAADSFSRSFGENTSVSTARSRGKSSAWNFSSSLGMD